MLDEIDDFIFSGFEYKGKKFKSVIKGDISLDKSESTERKKSKERYEKLLEFIKERLKEEVKDVRLSGRLKESTCCLVSDEGALDPNMERIMKAMGQHVPPTKKILEINPLHPLFEAMNRLFGEDRKGERLSEYITLLYDQALVLEGSKPRDPVAFAKSISRLMVENAGQGNEEERP
jgi:molecular chaperone HtpG